MKDLARRVGAASLIAVTVGGALAHSSIAGFGAAPEAHDEHDNHVHGAPVRVTLYPGMVVIDPRNVQTVVVKVNATVVRMRALYVGKPVTRGEVLAELESAELTTVQNTYLGILTNLDAVKDFSLAVPQKLVEARMTLQWRGMGPADIDRLEATHKPLARIAIRAPASGFLYSLGMANGQILNAGVQAGLFTAAGTPVASVAQPGALLVETAVPVNEAHALRAGQKATVYLPDARRGWQPVPATVQAVPGLPSAATQRQLVRVVLNGAAKSAAYVNGLQVTVAFKGGRDAEHETVAD